MVRGRPLSEATRVHLLELRVRGGSFDAIALQTGIPKSTIVTTVGRGRPVKPKAREQRLSRGDAYTVRQSLLSSKSKPNWAVVSGDLQRLTGKVACEATIKRALVRFQPTAASAGITELISTKSKTVRAASRKALAGLLRSAIFTIDICVYILSSKAMMKLIVALSEEVKIRVISDGKESSTWYSNIQELAEAGVRVKLTPRTPDDMLHHKAGLISGSLNWSQRGLFDNHANLDVRYKDEDLSHQVYKKLFMSDWKTFKSVK
ncbi:hypothetical protein Gpo141_00000527 [Globisporangium polare]